MNADELVEFIGDRLLSIDDMRRWMAGEPVDVHPDTRASMLAAIELLTVVVDGEAA